MVYATSLSSILATLSNAFFLRLPKNHNIEIAIKMSIAAPELSSVASIARCL